MKRLVVLGSKHNTATYTLEFEKGDERHYLNFIDLGLHLALTANDNKHRTNYPRSKMTQFLAECVDKGYNHRQAKTYEDMEELYADLEKTFEKFYKKLWKTRKNIVIDCELPKLNGSLNSKLSDFMRCK